MFPALQGTFRRGSLEHARPRTDSVDGSPTFRDELQTSSPADPPEGAELSSELQQSHIVIDAGHGPATLGSEPLGAASSTAATQAGQQQLPDVTGTGFSRGQHFNPTLDVILYMENMGQRWLKARLFKHHDELVQTSKCIQTCMAVR